jgi:hypothetical protein
MPTAQIVKQTAKQAAISAAKRTVWESNETLKTAFDQIMPPTPETPSEKKSPIPSSSTKTENNQSKQQNQESAKPKDASFMREYKQELEEIKRQNLFKELQQKIADGEEIPLVDYAYELSSEQREVLQAQMDAVSIRKQAQEVKQKESIPQIISKRGKAMLSSFKKKNQQHVEMRQPPSG